MGRLRSSKKPAASTSEPAQSARAAAAKKFLSPKAKRETQAASSSIPLTEAQALADSLRQHDLRNFLHEILDSHPNTRAALKAFCEKPVSARGTIFDFGPILEKFRKAIDVVEGPKWEQADERDDRDARCDVWIEATFPIKEAIQQVEDLCESSKTSTGTKVKGMEALLDILDVLEDTQALDGGDWDFDNAQDDSQNAARSAIWTAIQSIIPEDREALFVSEPFLAVMARFKDDADLDSLVGEIQREMRGEPTPKEETFDDFYFWRGSYED